MGYQVHFQKARSVLIPVLEGADQHLLLEQRTRPCRGEATLTQYTLRTQEAIGRCRTHGKQLPTALLSEVEVLISLQCFY